MKVKEKKAGKSKVALEISCEFCGKPISKTSVDFGMDCEDDCGRKQWVLNGFSSPRADLEFVNQMIAQALGLKNK